ncbi:Histone deacetylase 8 [Nymphon striatum]|nr:Histone deacetylase 8 [Nymphon striatum]
MDLNEEGNASKFIDPFMTDIFNYEEDDLQILHFTSLKDKNASQFVKQQKKQDVQQALSGTTESESEKTNQDFSSYFPERNKDSKSNVGKPVYVCSIAYLKYADLLPKVPKRVGDIYLLVSPKIATYDDLRRHHIEDYLELLKSTDDDNESDVYDEYGLGYDCPVLESTYEYVKLMAGATLTAAQHLVDKTTQVAINWGGGWHHAKRGEASGFCYVNDIVLGILHLRQVYDKILYVDLDLHHGDGVEEAFANTSKVMTVSFHLYEPGFFPGSGSLSDIGFGKGKYYSVNVPLRSGIKNQRYIEVFLRIMNKVHLKFKPDAIVCQCGADCLTGDPMLGFNVTSSALGTCIQYLLSWKVPILFLGGGGYHMANTARCWTYLTSVILGTRLDSSIPDNHYFMCYKPGFELEITPGNRPDKNNNEYIDQVIKSVSGDGDEWEKGDLSSAVGLLMDGDELGKKETFVQQWV